MPVPSNIACCIYDKCLTNGSLAYMWHLKRDTQDYTLAHLPQYIYTYTITQYILARMRVHTYTVHSHVVSLKFNNFQTYTYRPSNAIYN